MEIMDELKLKKNNYNIELFNNFLTNFPTYLVVAENMGCYTIIRRKNDNYDMEGLTVSNEDYYNEYNINFIKKFIDGYSQVAKTIIFTHDK